MSFNSHFHAYLNPFLCLSVHACCKQSVIQDKSNTNSENGAAGRGPLLQPDVEQAPSIMSVAEAEAIFMARFNLPPSDGSSGAALTAASTAALGLAEAPEEAPAPAPAESMSRAEPPPAGAVASFVLDSFQCPLTMEVMRDPVITVDGQTYERTEIEKWFALGNRTSPLTGEALPSTNLFPNIALRTVIRENALL
jgi:hypothetical protein